ncbi:MAG: SAM-dependent methyltransferase, partial [Acidobacteria bacterium]|nr:SAM-dependent methyltransferase [Acidobacteriota bacterium]
MIRRATPNDARMNDLGLRALPASSSSLRDPAGRLIATQGRLIRLIHKSWIPHVQAFLNSQTARELSRSGKLVSSRVLDTASAAEILAEETFADLCPADELGMVLEHEPVFFPSFAHEWPAEMLHAAGQLTLELARSLLREGLGIKDATPYNVLFSGSQLVFVDVLSVEQRDPHDPVWLPYAQFARTFLLPLLAHREFAMPVHQIFLSRRDGLEPSEFYRWSGPFQKLLPPTLTLSSIPTWFHSRAEASDSSMYQARRLRNPAQARFVLESLFKRLSRTLERLKPPCRKSSRWSDYMLL